LLPLICAIQLKWPPFLSDSILPVTVLSVVVDVTVTLSVKVVVVADGVRVSVERFVEITTVGNFAIVTVLLLVGTR
jgi:hypothetical protein